MRKIRFAHPLVAAVALASNLTLMQGAAVAQSVHVFEYTPPLEVLRSILIPESTGGASRRIILTQPDAGAPSPVQPAAASVPAAPQPQQAASAPAPSPAPADAPSSGPSMAPRPEPAAHHAPAAATRPARPAAAPTAASAGPAPERMDAAAGIVGFRINFALDSAAIPAAADSFLDELAELLKQEPKVALVVEGHTDAYGTDQYNLQLSKLRAEAVVLALVRRGVAAERLSPVGKGKREPLAANPFDPNNRRVQFVRVDGAGT